MGCQPCLQGVAGSAVVVASAAAPLQSVLRDWRASSLNFRGRIGPGAPTNPLDHRTQVA